MAKVNLKKPEHFSSYFLDENGEFDPSQWQTGVFIQHERLCTFHMSQEEFAEAFGVSVEDLSSWERCVGAPPQSFIDAIYAVKEGRKELHTKSEDINKVLKTASDVMKNMQTASASDMLIAAQMTLLCEVLAKLNNIEKLLSKDTMC